MADHPTPSKPAAPAAKPAAAPAPSKPAAAATGAETAQAEKHQGHGDKPAGAKKKKGGKGKEGPSLKERIGQTVVFARAQFVEIVRGLVSPDGPTRRMSLFFFVSLAGVVTLGILTVQRNMRLKEARLAAEVAETEEAEARSHEAALLGKTVAAEANPHALSMLNVGQFTIELKPIAAQDKHAGGFMNMAEVELVIECDSKETHDYIEENLVAARSQITDIFLSMDRDELLSRDGKRKLKKRLLERLNGWIPRGKVQNVFFSKLVVA